LSLSQQFFSGKFLQILAVYFIIFPLLTTKIIIASSPWLFLLPITLFLPLMFEIFNKIHHSYKSRSKSSSISISNIKNHGFWLWFYLIAFCFFKHTNQCFKLLNPALKINLSMFLSLKAPNQRPKFPKTDLNTESNNNSSIPKTQRSEPKTWTEIKPNNKFRFESKNPDRKSVQKQKNKKTHFWLLFIHQRQIDFEKSKGGAESIIEEKNHLRIWVYYGWEWWRCKGWLRIEREWR